MNIADKTLQLKKDFDDVYKAGQSSMVDESKIIEKTVSGEYISVDDVSEIPHEVEVKLTSGGKNLFNEQFRQGNFENSSTNRISSTQSINIKSGQAYTISTNLDLTLFRVGIGTYPYSPPVKSYDRIEGWSIKTQQVITITPSVSGYLVLDMARNDGADLNPETIKDYWFMIEQGDTATEYEPYKETLTDYSGVSLTRCGGNLATLSEYVGKSATKNGITATIIEGGIIQVTGTPTNSAVETAITLSLPKTLQLPAGNYACDPNVVLSSNLVRAFFGAYSGDGKWIKNFQIEANAIDVPFYVSNITVYIKAGTVTTEVNKLLPLTLERGSKFTLTEYEPYNGQTLTANSDGTVEGVESTSPYMYMTTDNKNVTINAEYHKSYGIQTEYDRFWDTYQDEGNRTDYTNAFSGIGWVNEIFKPKYPIDSPLKYNQLFRFAFITHINYDLNLTKMTNANLVFDSCTKLVKIQKIITNENVTYTQWFGWCMALETIAFDGIIGKSIDFQYSTKLTKASILNILNALSPTITGQTLTLSKTAVTNAFGSTTATEWTNLVATKTNWTISLV